MIFFFLNKRFIYVMVTQNSKYECEQASNQQA